MRKILTILILTIFIFGCNKDNKPVNLELKSPLNTTTSSCNVELTWNETFEDTPFIIDIATDANFENVIITDTTASTVYKTNGNVQPNHKHYWRIYSGNQEAKDSFNVENTISDFIGTFQAICTWHNDGAYPFDSTWTTTVKIEINENGIPIMIDLNGNIQIKPATFSSNTNCFIFNYENIFPDRGYSLRDCELNLDDRTFEFYSNNGSSMISIFRKYTGSID